jgi:8-oxo-dGTP pyrophosphatase MutT (NUDIX family)
MQSIYYRAAGGVVVHADQVLLLDRPARDEVRLPKGHIEAGESPEQAALREVREETGYIELKILADLGMQQTHFVRPFTGEPVTRDEFYFLMRLLDDTRVDRDAHEHQFVPIWVSLAGAVSRLTYETEREFVCRALRWLQENALSAELRC